MVKVAVLRRESGISFSMDVCANGLVGGLNAVRPDWEIVELRPGAATSGSTNPWFKGLGKYYRRYWLYPRQSRQCDVDVFHVIDHSDGHLAYWLTKTKKPVVVTCHDLINFFQPDNIRDQARLAAVSTAIWKYAVRGLTKADHIVTVSEHTARDVVKLLAVDAQKITPVANGVDPAFVQLPEACAVIRAWHSLPLEKFCLLHVGSNHPRKNVLTVLKVLKALLDQGLPVHLIKAGAEFNAAQTAFIEENGLGGAIAHFSKPGKSTLVDLYNAADVLLSPSCYEGFGITLLEAMACGTPVVTSNVTSLPEVVGEAGIMADPLDVTALSQAVWHLSEDADHRNDLIQRGFKRVERFTWAHSAEQVAQVYEKLLDL